MGGESLGQGTGYGGGNYPLEGRLTKKNCVTVYYVVIFTSDKFLLYS